MSVSPQRNRICRIAFYSGVGLLLLLFLLFFFGPLRYFPGPSPSQTERELRRALPRGTSQDAVIAYLDNRRIEHSPQLGPDGALLAIERNTCHMILVECDTEISILFDKQE